MVGISVSGGKVGGTGKVVLVATTVVVVAAAVEPIVITTGAVSDGSSEPTVSTRLGSSSPPVMTSSAATPPATASTASPPASAPHDPSPRIPALRQAPAQTIATDKGFPGSTMCGARFGPSGGPVWGSTQTACSGV